jgi:hypothetical protein
MEAFEGSRTFIVRLSAEAGGLAGVVHRVKTGKKERVQGVEEVSRAIAAMLLAEEGSMSLDGKRALITGGSRGIGRGIALKLAERGVKVGIHYHENQAAARETLERVKKHGSDGFVVQADLTRPEAIGAVVERARAEFGALDIFVSNARPELPRFYRERPEHFARGLVRGHPGV